MASAQQAVLEERMKNLEVTNSKEHEEIKNTLTEVKVSIKEWMESADKKYASKNIEKIVYTGAGALGLWALNQVFHLIEIH